VNDTNESRDDAQGNRDFSKSEFKNNWTRISRKQTDLSVFYRENHRGKCFTNGKIIMMRLYNVSKVVVECMFAGKGRYG